MLKNLIRSEIKEAIILLVFAGLLFETLTPFTMAFVFLGSVLVWFKIKPGALVRNLIAVGMLISYWITYGKMIDPEIGLNFLTSIIVIKLLEKESQRDRYMIFFGLTLIISAGSLFQKSISYVLFFSLSFFILIQDFYKNLKLSTRLTDLFQALIWVLPFTILLFFFAPRMMNPFQLDKGNPREGEVGYTPEVNITQIESLASNDRPVFQALVDVALEPEDLYWRGNTLSFSDGWNWPLMPQDRSTLDFDPTMKIPTEGISQKIRVFSEQEFYFGLDHPRYIYAQNGVASLNDSGTLAQHRWRKSLRYEVFSQKNPLQNISQETVVSNLTGLKLTEKEWINQTFTSTDLKALNLEIQKYFSTNKFSYSLSPGRVENLLEFMQTKRVGFCSHYASAVAQILRTKKIPTRLVSGFMGGVYNKYAGFYLITHNDAHVWIEALYQGQWVRIDPTSWIAPDRVRLGGEAFIQQLNPNALSAMNALGSRFPFLNEFRQWFNQWDFKFYQWLEEMDYYGQSAIFEKLELKREWIFSLVPLLLALFMGLYAWHLTRKKVARTAVEELWILLKNNLSKKGIDLPLASVQETRRTLELKAPHLLGIFDELTMYSYKDVSEIDESELRKKIKRL